MIFYKCKTCQLYLPQQKACQLMIPQTQGTIEPDDYCSKHESSISTCEICGGSILKPFIETEGENEEAQPHTYCYNCLLMKEQEQWAKEQQNP